MFLRPSRRPGVLVHSSQRDRRGGDDRAWRAAPRAATPGGPTAPGWPYTVVGDPGAAETREPFLVLGGRSSYTHAAPAAPG